MVSIELWGEAGVGEVLVCQPWVRGGCRLIAVIRLLVPDRPLVERAVIGFGAAAKVAREVRPHLLRASDWRTIDV